MTFDDLGLSAPLLRALAAAGYAQPTPIQQKAIPPALLGRDVLGCAQTGTGKTAGFTLPMLQRLATPGGRGPRGLVLAPTRELAEQIQGSLRGYGQHLALRTGMIIGGVNARPQEQMLQRGVDILVATPGRLLDHLQRGTARLAQVEVFVLDEADRMLDMGFIRDIRRIVAALPRRRQTMLFSATLPAPIAALCREMLHDPVKVEAARPATTPTQVRQLVMPTTVEGKRPLLLRCLAAEDVIQAIIFCRTKRGADKLCQFLAASGHSAAVIHGNKSQSQRRSALGGFRAGRLRLLVATDIAARGLDVVGVSHVFNFELPEVPEDYVHRIGRTGRAEASGTAVSLMSAAERPLVAAIERMTGSPLAGNEPGSGPAAAPMAGGRPQGHGRRQGEPASRRRRRPAAIGR